MNFVKKLTPVNYSTGRYLNGSPQRVRYIVMHTMVGTIQSAENRFFTPNQVSAHYGVALNGDVRQWVDEANTAWHAGDWPINTQSIGIEHEDNGDYNGVRSDALYDSSARLLADLVRRYALPLDRSTVRLHKEVSDAPTGCPDALDVDRIIRQAQDILGGRIAAAAPDAPAHADFAVTPVDLTVNVTIDTLKVHNTPFSSGDQSDAGAFANTPDGMVHAGTPVHIIGWLHSQDEDYSAGGGKHTDVWLKTLNALGQSHYIWAGGTDYPLPGDPAPTPPAPPAEPAPAPEPPAPTPPAQPVVQPLEPAEVKAETSDTPAVEPPKVVITQINPQVKLLLPQTAIVTDLVTKEEVQVVPRGTELTIAGLTVQEGTTYLVTDNSLTNNLNHGINQIYFTAPAEPVVDGIKKAEAVKVPVEAVPALEALPGLWQKVLKFLHIIH